MAFIVERDGTLYDGDRWGLSRETVEKLAQRLMEFWERFQNCFRTKTHDTSKYGYCYLKGLLRMQEERNFSRVGREAGVSEQNMQHFMSESTWSAEAVIEQIQNDIASTPELRTGGVLLLDESADEKAGDNSSGAARQYNGRLGKVDMSQVGTFLGYVNLDGGKAPLWTWVDGELYIPEKWFTPEMAEKRERLGIPPDREFMTKIELGWKMIERLLNRDFPFEAVCCDGLYGRSGWLQAQLRSRNVIYMADIPKNTLVYLEQPQIGIPERQPGQRGPQPTQPCVLAPSPVTVEHVGQLVDTQWDVHAVRTTERGVLCDFFAMRRVWIVWENEPVEHWLVIRRYSSDRSKSYSLCNADINTSPQRLAWLKCQRFFVEQTFREAKSEIGWDELRAQKYRAWQHHLALCCLACWFIAQTKFDWASQHHRDMHLTRELGSHCLPNLSIANVREMLRAVMPLRQLSIDQAISSVTRHLVNRARSRASRIRSQRRRLRTGYG